MRNVTVIYNPDRDVGLIYTHKLERLFSERGSAVRLVMLGAQSYGKAELYVVVGGDGSILRVAREAAELNIPILGVNLGHLGYMAELEATELELLARLFDGNYTVERRSMLKIELSGGRDASYALNDAVISNGAVSRMVDLELYCGESFVGHYRADGLICATPTGSTAYSLSAGGPVIDPSLDCIAVTPVSPHSLRARPMIFAPNCSLTVKDRRRAGDELYLTVDGEENYRIGEDESVTVTRAEIYASLIKIKRDGFFETLNNKMSD